MGCETDMRLLATADLHFNHPRSRPLATDVIGQMNRAGGDVLLVIGDTAAADGDDLEQCLSQFTNAGPKLFLCGNHELWTRRGDSGALFDDELPRRVAALGWTWLEGAPFVAGDVAIVGTVGWYDYTFASARLAIPRRFYEAKMSPGAATYLGRGDLLGDDVSPEANELVARWNDGKFVTLGRTDDVFVGECVGRLTADLGAVAGARRVVAASHHVPFAELMPPTRYTKLDFAKAYLGSERIGEAILRHPNVSHVYCGHSHFGVRARVGHVDAINIGSSYRHKVFETLDL